MWWLGAFVLLLFAEIVTVTLTSIWFALGALAAFVVSLFCDIIWVQTLVFLLVSLVLLFFTRPFAAKYININREKTNVDALVGKQGVVTKEIDNLKACGEVKLSGQTWTARAALEGIVIPEGAIVSVREIRGVKLIVEQTGSAE